MSKKDDWRFERIGASMKNVAVYVCSGMSSRMEAFKPMLEIDSESAVRRIILTLCQGGAEPIVLITGNRGNIGKARFRYGSDMPAE